MFLKCAQDYMMFLNSQWVYYDRLYYNMVYIQFGGEMTICHPLKFAQWISFSTFPSFIIFLFLKHNY